MPAAEAHVIHARLLMRSYIVPVWLLWWCRCGLDSVSGRELRTHCGPSPRAAQTRAWGPLGRFAEFFGDSAEAQPGHHSAPGFVEGPAGLQGINTDWSLVKLGLDSSSVLVHWRLRASVSKL